ncbi:hypothetical protein [Sinorhizobium meliloti]|uniref:hypothetical protein n=1 Tax=Rhizobium meliloti TaxID=382 RepID=UPI0013E37277|nr:hypothetical protein [Sinorhizobium meliloti]
MELEFNPEPDHPNSDDRRRRIWANTMRDIDELQTRRTAIEQSQKDGIADTEREGRAEERFKQLGNPPADQRR